MNRSNPIQALPVDPSTRLFGLFGDPVAHSLGPAVHNQALAKAGINAVYLAFRVRSRDLAGAMAGVRALPLAGVSITIPHKVAVMKHLDRIDHQAQAMGAVNTVVNRRGILEGLNTDCRAAVKALEEKLDPSGKKVAVIGAGGAARAIAFGLVQKGSQVVIVNRSHGPGSRLARDLEAEFRPLEGFHGQGLAAVINATAVGMAPETGAMVIDPAGFDPQTVVMDIVYNPLETAFLRAARRAGCPVIDGLAMFVYQAGLQFELWTGSKAPLDYMRQVAQKALKKAHGGQSA